MQKTLIFLILLSVVTSCKKEAVTESVTSETNADYNYKVNFYFRAFDARGYDEVSNPSNNFKITFTEADKLSYSFLMPCSQKVEFTINNMKDGNYVYKISDSLNLFGYTQDSLIIRHGKIYFGQDRSIVGDLKSDNNLVKLGDIDQKPNFSILKVISKDTAFLGMPSIYIEVTADGTNNIRGGLIVYYYKNRTVSSNNVNNYCSLYNGGFLVSNEHPVFSYILPDYNTYEYMQKGDSVYYVVYSTSMNKSSTDYLIPKNNCGRYQLTSLGSQKFVIPYKLR